MPILPDVLETGLKVVFCGTAVGTQSAKARCYYAGQGNKFWQTLRAIGLTPRQFAPREFPLLLQYGVGLTDLNQRSFGADRPLRFSGEDRDLLRAKIIHFRPRVIAFTSKTAAEKFFERPMSLGRQVEPIGFSLVFVLPSTSGLANRTKMLHQL